MKKLCLILALATMALAAQTARAAEPIVDRWDSPTITRTLESLGATQIRAAALNGRPGLLATTPDGLNLGLYAQACTPSQANPSDPAICHAVEFILIYDPGAGPDRSLLVDRLNHDFALGKFTAERDGSIQLVRYLNLTGGVTEANLKAELGEFFAVAAQAKLTVWNAPAS